MGRVSYIWVFSKAGGKGSCRAGREGACLPLQPGRASPGVPSQAVSVRRTRPLPPRSPSPHQGPPCSTAGWDGARWIAPKTHVSCPPPPPPRCVRRSQQPCGPGQVANATAVSPSVTALLPPCLFTKGAGTLPGPGDPGVRPGPHQPSPAGSVPVSRPVTPRPGLPTLVATCLSPTHRSHSMAPGGKPFLGIGKGGGTWGHPAHAPPATPRASGTGTTLPALAPVGGEGPLILWPWGMQHRETSRGRHGSGRRWDEEEVGVVLGLRWGWSGREEARDGASAPSGHFCSHPANKDSSANERWHLQTCL